MSAICEIIGGGHADDAAAEKPTPSRSAAPATAARFIACGNFRKRTASAGNGLLLVLHINTERVNAGRTLEDRRRPQEPPAFAITRRPRAGWRQRWRRSRRDDAGSVTVSRATMNGSVA